jgi:hypothetical protein
MTRFVPGEPTRSGGAAEDFPRGMTVSHDPGGRRLSGMMISRRPKRRASRENAPGPRKSSAREMTVRQAKFISRGGSVTPPYSSHQRLKARLPAAARQLAIGVKKPASSIRPIIVARIAADHRGKIARAPQLSMLQASSAAPMATVHRSRKRPTPGHPSGKLEKSFCSLGLLRNDTPGKEEISAGHELPHP